MNIINDRPVMVFKKDNKYTIAISKKKKDNTYEKAYIKIEFGKDIELEDKTLIKIKNAWLDFYNWEYEDRKGTIWVIKCNEFEVVNEIQKQATNGAYTNSTDVPVQLLNTKTESDFGGQIRITDEDLPF